MQPQRRLFRLFLFGLLVATVLAVASAGVQRHGPELAVYAALCGPAGNEPCEQPVLNGGFPLGFFYDRPGVPPEDYLVPRDDQFRPLPFLLDVVFYFGLLSLSWRMGQARRRLRAEARVGKK